MTTVKINLLPPEIKKKRVAEKGFVMLVGVLVVVIGLCSLITVILFMESGKETKIIEAKKAEVAKVASKIGEYSVYQERQNQVQAHMTALEQVLKNEVYWHRFMNEISMVIPADASLKSLKLDETGQITMDGNCYEYETVSELLVRLSDLDMIKDIWLQSADTQNIEQSEVIGQSNTSASSSNSVKVAGIKFSIIAKLKNPVIPPPTNGPGGTGGSKSSPSGGEAGNGSGG